MKKVLSVLVVLGFLSAVTAFAEDAPAVKAAAGVFMCDKCAKVGTMAGKCDGADMKAMKVLAIKDGTAYCCACGADCAKCTMKDADAAKCACGKDIVKLSLKGKFVCSAGADCKLNTIADKAGKCGCGKDLVEVK